jgi:hypothetical protein
MIIAVAIGWFAGPAAGWFAGLFGAVAVLLAWRAGVAGDASRNWARALYGPGEQDGSDHASIMARRLSGRDRRARGEGRSASDR